MFARAPSANEVVFFFAGSSATRRFGEALSAQQGYFKDSKVRHENGQLLKIYHGTESEFYFQAGERLTFVPLCIMIDNGFSFWIRNAVFQWLTKEDFYYGSFLCVHFHQSFVKISTADAISVISAVMAL